MIKTEQLVPQVYYNRSRDFQFLGRLYDIIFNYVKTETNLVKESTLNENTDNKLIDLICTTLGFKQMHHYNIKQLKAICSIFMVAIRNKGNLLSIYYAVYAILHISGIVEEPVIRYLEETKVLEIYLSYQLTDKILLYDVLDYILPAGISCKIYAASEIEANIIRDSISAVNRVSWEVAASEYWARIQGMEDYDLNSMTFGVGRDDSMMTPTNDWQEPESGE